MRPAICIIIVTFGFLSGSCAGRKHDNNVKEAFLKYAANGKVTENIICKEDQTNTYAVYLPSSYSLNTKFPVIYAFDPHGNGALPVELFKKSAEKYGYIVVGSNKCQNGMSNEDINNAISVLFSDTRTKLSIDSERIYTAGFSGGSRIASAIALNYGHVRGVIGCSAGFTINNQPVLNFDFIGIAGNQDMNYLEMANLEESLNKINMKHYFLVFDGKHEWPPEEIIFDAVRWLQINAIKDNLIPKDQALINGFIDNNVKLINLYKSDNEQNKLYATYLKMAFFLKGLTDVSRYELSADSMLKIADFSKKIADLKTLGLKEQEKQEIYQGAFQGKDLTWWKTEINKLGQAIKSPAKEQESMMNKRLLAYISLVAFSYTNYELRSNDLNSVSKSLSIYGMVDPENPDYHYFLAAYDAAMKNDKKAIGSLKKAIFYGYSDYRKLKNDPAFANLHGTPEFEELFSKQKVDR